MSGSDAQVLMFMKRDRSDTRWGCCTAVFKSAWGCLKMAIFGGKLVAAVPLILLAAVALNVVDFVRGPKSEEVTR